jgi:hypothetical protein
MLSITKKTFFIFIGIYIFATIYLAWSTPISPHEAKLFFQYDNPISLLMHTTYDSLGSFLSLRIVFILFGYVSVYLYYQVAKEYFNDINITYFSTVVFAFLPGMITASVLANISIIVLPLVLAFVLFYNRSNYIAIGIVMLLLFFIHEASVIFFISIFIYSIISKDKKLFVLSSSFLIATIYLAKGIAIGGRPSGHFADIFGLYAGVFSPLVFLYFFYTNYRILLREKKHLIWYISFVALIVSLILSIRQKIYITDFAPYVLISIVSMIEVFQKSLLVRLPQYQQTYKRAYYIVMSVFIFASMVIILHKPIYYLLDKPHNFFAFKLYYPYELSYTNQCIKNLQSKYKYQCRFYNSSKKQNSLKNTVSKIHNTIQ